MSGSLTQLYLSNPALATALRRRQQGEQMTSSGMDTSPTSWAGALARLAQAYVGQRDINRADEQIKGIGEQQDQEFKDFMKGGASTVPLGGMPAPVPLPVAPQASAAPSGDPNAPLTDRQNNPGALRFAGQPGATNVNGFASFPTRDAGMAAADAQLGLYGSKYGINTLADAISRWAPPNENDTQAYIKRVADASGIDPNAPIDLTDKAVRDRILPHMFAVEGGPRSIAGGRAQLAANIPPNAATDAGGPPDASAGGAAGGPPRASPLADVYMQQALILQQRAQAAAASQNPRIQAQAPLLMQQATLYATLGKEKPKTNVLRPGGMLVDDQGRVIARAPDDTGPLNVIQDGVDEKGNPRWKYATRPAAVGQTAPTPGPLVNVDQRGLNAEAQERGKSLAEEAKLARDQAAAAAGTIDQVRQLRSIGAETDRLAPAREVIGSALNALGVKGSDAVKSAATLEAFNGALSGLVLGAQLAQKGVQTEGDAQRMREQYAKSTNTMQANDFLMRATEAQAARQMEKADFYERWYGEHGNTYAGAQQAWNQFIRDVPLTVRAPSGVVFYNDFANYARGQGASDDEIRAQWKARAGAK